MRTAGDELLGHRDALDDLDPRALDGLKLLEGARDELVDPSDAWREGRDRVLIFRLN